ncbi:MAG: hypothetical protein L0Z70_11185 [Chloroflexi bacterium]|nr:hypothetical protein [Chloroflexota bacterium]
MKCGSALAAAAENPAAPAQNAFPHAPQQPGYTPRQQQASWESAGMPSFTVAAPLIHWGPFAGYGWRRQHLGWLVEGQGERAREAAEKVGAKLNERKIPGAQIQFRQMTARGLTMEARPYYLLQRGLVSLGLHIASYGKDLFISLVSYIKTPISNFRIAILAVMALFWLYTTFIYTDQLRGAFYGYLGALGSLFGETYTMPSSSGVTNLLCLIGPLGLINSVLFYAFWVFGAYKWLTEKDLWAGLRAPANEFNHDDLMALEKSVEESVRLSLEELGLEAEMKPIAPPAGRRGL